jgi:hypothetical protein
MEMQVMVGELLSATKSFDLAGDIAPAHWPEIGAISVPLRFSNWSCIFGPQALRFAACSFKRQTI